MTDNDVLIKSLFRLDIANPGKVIEVYDEIDYAGAGDDINDFVGVLDISGPGGTIYKNIDFGNPDIIPGTSRKIIPLVYLILDPQNDYWPLQGQYTIKYTIQEAGTLNEYTETFIYGFHFDEPEMSLDVDSGPYSAKLRSTDLTDYGSNIDTLVREHRITYPANAPGGPIPDIVSTLAFVEVDPIYTNLWTSKVSTTVDYYQAGDDLWYTWYGEIEVEHCVMGACIDSMYNALDTMFIQYQAYLEVNRVQAELYAERLMRANTAFMLLDIAWRANDVEEADKQAAIIQEVIELSGISDCDPAGSSALVNPCPLWGGSGIIPAVYTFSNGITEVAGAVKLGGSLTKDTTITLGAFDIDIAGVSAGGTAGIHIETGAAAAARLSADDGSTAGRVYAEIDRVLMARVDLGTPANTRQYEITSAGLVEAADYSAGYGNLNLVNKGYVDANNDWGAQVVVTDATITGDGTSGDPLVVAVPFPGFTSLLVDYGYTEPTHAFSEITSKPTTISGYGITDAVTAFTDLSDVPSSYATHANKFVVVNATANGLTFATASGWVPITGGIFTGQVIHKVNTNYPLVVQRDGVAGTPGIADASINRIAFWDSDGDLQGYVGIDGSGNLGLYTAITGGLIYADGNLNVQGNITVTGLVDTVDLAGFKTLYDAHIIAANPHGTNMEDLADVPAYAGNALKIPRINAEADAIEWIVATSADKYYLHVQGAASNTWNINHGLNKYPAVLIMDDLGNVIEADGIQHTDLNNTIITFTSAVDGQAAFN